MTKHTPGPWHHHQNASGSYVIDTVIVEGTKFVGNVICTESTNINARADHRLIAAAPDLLAACEAMQRVFASCGDGIFGPYAVQVRAAIAKATGA